MVLFEKLTWATALMWFAVPGGLMIVNALVLSGRLKSALQRGDGGILLGTRVAHA